METKVFDLTLEVLPSVNSTKTDYIGLLSRTVHLS